MAGEQCASGVVSRALKLISHRGPDSEGIWSSPTGHCVLGHRRLSIIDLSAHANQPMGSTDSKLHLVFNGEIYNYLELKSELRADWTFGSESDTEVLLAALAKWGPTCLNRLIAMFAFALWDDEKQELFVARDRFGVKPLYFTTLPDGTFAVASEVKALLALGTPSYPDQVAWATYLAYGLYDHSDRTFWKGINALRPGHSLRWRDGSISIERWYDLGDVEARCEDPRCETQVAEEYMNLMIESVRLRFRSDVPIGINLSGGWIPPHCLLSFTQSRVPTVPLRLSPLLLATLVTTSFHGLSRCSSSPGIRTQFVASLQAKSQSSPREYSGIKTNHLGDCRH